MAGRWLALSALALLVAQCVNAVSFTGVVSMHMTYYDSYDLLRQAATAALAALPNTPWTWAHGPAPPGTAPTVAFQHANHFAAIAGRPVMPADADADTFRDAWVARQEPHSLTEYQHLGGASYFWIMKMVNNVGQHIMFAVPQTLASYFGHTTYAQGGPTGFIANGVSPTPDTAHFLGTITTGSATGAQLTPLAIEVVAAALRRNSFRVKALTMNDRSDGMVKEGFCAGGANSVPGMLCEAHMIIDHFNHWTTSNYQYDGFAGTINPPRFVGWLEITPALINSIMTAEPNAAGRTGELPLRIADDNGMSDGDTNGPNLDVLAGVVSSFSGSIIITTTSGTPIRGGLQQFPLFRRGHVDTNTVLLFGVPMIQVQTGLVRGAFYAAFSALPDEVCDTASCADFKAQLALTIFLFFAEYVQRKRGLTVFSANLGTQGAWYRLSGLDFLVPQRMRIYNMATLAKQIVIDIRTNGIAHALGFTTPHNSNVVYEDGAFVRSEDGTAFGAMIPEGQTSPKHHELQSVAHAFAAGPYPKVPISSKGVTAGTALKGAWVVTSGVLRFWYRTKYLTDNGKGELVNK